MKLLILLFPILASAAKDSITLPLITREVQVTAENYDFTRDELLKEYDLLCQNESKRLKAVKQEEICSPPNLLTNNDYKIQRIRYEGSITIGLDNYYDKSILDLRGELRSTSEDSVLNWQRLCNQFLRQQNQKTKVLDCGMVSVTKWGEKFQAVSTAIHLQVGTPPPPPVTNPWDNCYCEFTTVFSPTYREFFELVYQTRYKIEVLGQFQTLNRCNEALTKNIVCNQEKRGK